MADTPEKILVCTWDEESDCKNCEAEGQLHCKWDKSILNVFIATSIPPYILYILGMVMVGLMTHIWLPLIVYIAILIIFFGFYEIRILCSHCPYYAGDQKSLKCLGNNGALKLWKFHPQPMNGSERAGLVIGFTLIYAIFPILINGYGIYYLVTQYAGYNIISLLGMVGVTVGGLIMAAAFFAVMFSFFCPNCLNFSCPLNGVPKEMVDAYLEKNQVMREAWEKSGWQLGPKES